MNLYEKMIEVRKSVESLKKDVDKEGLKYKYVSGNQILSKIKDSMNSHGLILQPSIKVGHHETFDYKTQYGKELTDFIVKGEMSYTWINAEKPEEREEIQWAYYGQQNEISKALGSGLTYSERYFLLKYFGLPTDEDDPDGKLTDGTESTPQPDKVTPKMLIDIAKSKNIDEKGLIAKYKKETGKEITEIKFMAQEYKTKYYNAIKELEAVKE